MLKTYITSYLLFLTTLLSSQNITADSLRQVLSQKQSIDFEYVDALNQLTINLILTDPVEGIAQANESLRLIETIEYPQGLFTALMHKGSAFLTSGLPDQALVYYYKARSVKGEISDKLSITLLNNTGEVFKQKKQFDSALFYYQHAIMASENSDEEMDISLLYYNVGELFLMRNQLDSATDYFVEAFKTSELTGNKRNRAYAFYGLGEILGRKSQAENAVRHHLAAKSIREDIGDRRGIIQSYQSLARLHSEQNNSDSALYYFQESIELAQSSVSEELLKKSYKDIAVFLQRTGNLSGALSYMHKHAALQDSLNRVAFISNSHQIKNVLIGELVEAENKLLKEEQEAQAIKNKAVITRVILLSAILFLIALVYYQYRLGLLARRNEQKIMERNKQLRDSAFVVSHNLREPVSQILGFIELNKATKDVPQKETWEHMEKAAVHIDSVVRQLAEQLHRQDDSDKK